MRYLTLTAMAIILSAACPAMAGPSDFEKGPVFKDFGQTAQVKTDFVIPKRAKFKVVFDTADGAKAGEVNKTLNSVARFINMHAKAGVPEKNLTAAIVFHGKGSFDLTQTRFYSAKYEGVENGNAAIIKALTDNGVRIILCGQTAAYYDIKNEDLLSGVEMALSAMTVHALLQQQGYTLNPF